MTNNIKMTRSINVSLSDGAPAKTAGSLSMISMLAISVGMAAVPAQAQEMESPATVAPVQATPVISPQPAPTASPTMAPTTAAPPASSSPAAKTAATPSATPERADDLASKGGFDAATVAPEALAQIEQEQQARKDAAAAAAAKSAAATRAAAAKPAPTRTNSATVTDSATQAAPALDADGSAALADGTAESLAIIPMVSPVAESAAAPKTMPADGTADWSLLAALAALLGVGSAGAYAATRRRKSKGQAATAARSNDPLPASLTAATISEPRRDPVEEEVRPTVNAEQATAQSLESKATTKADFAAFVANLPALDEQDGKAGRGTTMGHRRVAAAPKPYLAEADLSRTPGYFTAHVDAMPTPQNPFLTRQKRIKRARYLDGKLAGMKPSTTDSRTNISGKMQVSRPKEPAFA